LTPVSALLFPLLSSDGREAFWIGKKEVCCMRGKASRCWSDKAVLGPVVRFVVSAAAGALIGAWLWESLGPVLGGVIAGNAWFVVRAFLWTGRRGSLDAALWTGVWGIGWMMLAVGVHHLLHLGLGDPADEALHQQVFFVFVVGGLTAVVGSILVGLVGQMRRESRKRRVRERRQ
jgi:hypothetical protein